MGHEWKARSFKAGNSVAIRLPKALGLGEGEDIRIVKHDDGSFSFWRVSDDAAILDSLYGSMSPGFMKDGRGDIEQEDRSWDRDPVRAAA
jgi:antitoxin VapB